MPTSFSHANGAVTFARNPVRPVNPLEVLQPQGKTAAGLSIGHEPVVSERSIVLTWPAMLSSDLEALLTFWAEIADGGANSFTFTDVSANQVSVYFHPSPIKISERTPDSAEVVVVLLRA